MFPPCSSIPPKILKNIFQKNSHRYLKTFRLWNLANKYTAKESIWYGRRFLELRPSVSFCVEIFNISKTTFFYEESAQSEDQKR
jgi:hypothetical protein